MTSDHSYFLGVCALTTLIMARVVQEGPGVSLPTIPQYWGLSWIIKIHCEKAMEILEKPSSIKGRHARSLAATAQVLIFSMPESP